MAIVVGSSGIQFGAHWIAFFEFPALQDLHLHEAPGTRGIEARGQALAAAGFLLPDLQTFIEEVCAWGGPTGNRVRGIVFARNDLQDVRCCFRDAWRDLQQDSIESALACINQIAGLGQPSYATKHLRFLRPDICPVMDSYVRGEAPEYSYGQLRQAYEDVGAGLKVQRVPNRMARASRAWFVADVDMAIFAHIRYSGCQCAARQDQHTQTANVGLEETVTSNGGTDGSAVDERFFGAWTGQVSDKRTGSYMATIRLARGEGGEITGSSEYVIQRPRRGSLTLKTIHSQAKVEFDDRIRSEDYDQRLCISGYTTLTLSDAYILYEWRGPQSRGKAASATGRLRRP